ncbi:MAG: DUF1841 family protein [Candidatus Thermoplasmatota archaeon]|nr:DUF1841 family protein [Candidatus Thermoplasmatota archaeon]
MNDQRGGSINNKEEEIEYNPILHDAIHTGIEEQIENNEPEEVKETLNRLMELGYDRHETIHKIGRILIEEIYKARNNEKNFNTKHYITRLEKLK